jgi:hypothetical protein
MNNDLIMLNNYIYILFQNNIYKMTTNVQIFGSTGGQENLWKGIKESTGVNIKANIDFSNLSGDLALSSSDPTDNYTSVGGFIKSDLKNALFECRIH